MRNTIDESLEEIMGMYDTAFTEIEDLLYYALDYNKNPNFSKISTSQLKLKIYEILDGLYLDIEDYVPAVSEQVAQEGYDSSYLAYLTAMGILSTDELNRVPSNIVSESINEMMASVLNVIRNSKNSITNMINGIMSKHLQITTLIGRGDKVAAELILKTVSGKKLHLYVDRNIIAIVDSIGRKWRVSTYLEMLVKTKLQQLLVGAMKEFTNTTGLCDLALIPHVNTDDECNYFLGLIISMTGLTQGYITYDSLQSTGMIFHPRCRHTPKPIYDLNLVDAEIIAYHNEVSKNLKNILG